MQQKQMKKGELNDQSFEVKQINEARRAVVKLLKEQRIEYDKNSNGLQTSIDKALAAYKEEKGKLDRD